MPKRSACFSIASSMLFLPILVPTFDRKSAWSSEPIRFLRAASHLCRTALASSSRNRTRLDRFFLSLSVTSPLSRLTSPMSRLVSSPTRIPVLKSSTRMHLSRLSRMELTSREASSTPISFLLSESLPFLYRRR